ncbi:MAG: hypothetical protein ACWGOL_04785 [Desulfuromonadales bacterium]
MTDSLLLIFAAFLSSSLTAVLGLGGGMLLISLLAVRMIVKALLPL